MELCARAYHGIREKDESMEKFYSINKDSAAFAAITAARNPATMNTINAIPVCKYEPAAVIVKLMITKGEAKRDVQGELISKRLGYKLYQLVKALGKEGKEVQEQEQQKWNGSSIVQFEFQV